MATKTIKLSNGTDTFLPESATSGIGLQKCADGTLIQWGRSEQSVNFSSQWSGNGYYGASSSIAFWETFVGDNPSVTVTVASSTSAVIIGAPVNRTHITSIYAWRPASGTQTIIFSWVAVGRWK